MEKLAFSSGGRCEPLVVGGVFRDVARPVGAVEARKGGGNALFDVKTVQDLLNRIAAADGGARGTGKDGNGLVVDGLCGPLTRGAIKTFQHKQFPQFTPDTIVDPGGRTIYRLNLLAYPEVDEQLLAKGRVAVHAAGRYVSHTLLRLQFVERYWQTRNHPTMIDYSAEAKLCDKHFHLDRSTDPVRDVDQIAGVYRRMYPLLAHVPRGPNQKPAFGFIDYQPIANTRPTIPFAYTTAGGYYMQGVEGERFNSTERADMIYLTRNLLTLREPAVIYAIIHELAHFVGGRRGDIDFIRDRAYFHSARQKYDGLSTYEAMTNADSFAEYTWEVNTGTTLNSNEFKL